MIEYAGHRVSSGRQWGVGSVLGWGASALAWGLAAVVVMGVLGGILAFVLLPVFGFLAPAVVLTMVLIAASAVRDVRRRRALAALTYLEQAVRLNLPLTPMLASARRAERPGVAKRVLHMEELLAAGVSVSDAVEAALPELPGRVVRAIRSSERLGRLPEGLARAAEGERPREPHDPTRMFYRSYPLLLLAAVSVVVMFLIVFVMPKFESIFKDFGVPMPGVTRGLMSFAETFAPVLAVGSVALILVLTGRAMWDLFVPRRARVGTRWLTDPIEWALPLVGRAARDRGMADVCWLLADAVEAGLPIEQAIAGAERLDVNVMLYRRLVKWRENVTRGMGLAEGARRAWLPHMMVGMMGTSTADLGEVFRFLSRYYAGRFSRTQVLLRAAVVPAVAIGMGVVVAVVGLGLFVPMVTLINHMTPQIGRVL